MSTFHILQCYLHLLSVLSGFSHLFRVLFNVYLTLPVVFWLFCHSYCIMYTCFRILKCFSHLFTVLSGFCHLFKVLFNVLVTLMAFFNCSIIAIALWILFPHFRALFHLFSIPSGFSYLFQCLPNSHGVFQLFYHSYCVMGACVRVFRVLFPPIICSSHLLSVPPGFSHLLRVLFNV